MKIVLQLKISTKPVKRIHLTINFNIETDSQKFQRPNQKNFSPTKWSFFLEYNFGTLILKKWKLCTKNSIISRLVELTAQKWTHRNHSKHSLGQMHLKHPFLVSPLSATTGGEFASPKPIGSVF